MKPNESKELLDIYNKEDIMKMFKCESDKALRILRLMFLTRDGFKIGREYYVTKKSLEKFMEDIKGKSLYI